MRVRPTAVPFHVSYSGGQVLTTGGYNLNGPPSVKGYGTAAAELFDPVAGVSTFTAFLSEPRVGHSMVLLADGRALACGGEDYGGTQPPFNSFAALYTCELYNASTGSWELTGNMTQRLQQGGGNPVAWLGFTLSLLSNGSVLASGSGGSSASCVQQFNLFDPQTLTWTETGPVPASQGPQVLLPTGELLITAAFTSVAQCQSASSNVSAPTASLLYNPATGAISETGASGAFLNTALLF